VESTLRKSLKIFALGGSLRRRVAFSLAVVRLVLVPVIFLAVYYLFERGVIVDRIVNVDAPVASLAEQASVQMLDARRAERSYFLLRDPQYLQANKESVTQLKTIFGRIRELAPAQDPPRQGLQNVDLYEQQFRAAVSLRELGGYLEIASDNTGTIIVPAQQLALSNACELSRVLSNASSGETGVD
jgi:hypothetical protein